MSAHCDHLLFFSGGYECEIEVRVSSLPAYVVEERAMDERWLSAAIAAYRKPAADALARVQERLAGDYLASFDTFNYCPDCGAKIPPLKELLP